ncbi:hypothetical protein PHISP_07321 [Aspergillus sp. HF37]|nr:hypothetical protein PHISP_07321 [Aspergillus sp. HF37]
MPPNNAGSKRRREPFSVDVKMVEIYDDLANEKDEIRLKAAQNLVSQFTPDKKPPVDLIQKALQRLFRGICSSRKAARIGFSIALTEVLAQVFASTEKPAELAISDVLGVLESQSNAAGSETGQEQRDHHFGRLFGAEAIIKSSILFKPNPAFAEWTRLLDLVFGLAKSKPWIREECGWIVYRCVYELSSQKASVKFVETALERLCSNDLARTQEGVSIWLAVKDEFPKASFPAKVWKHDDPLDSRERNQLAKIMKDSSTPDPEDREKGNNAKSSGVWNSKLHFAWEAVLARVSDVPKKEKLKSKSKETGSRLSFADFWADLVDNGLFASASSEERKYWGFLLFVKVLNESPLQHASQVFTKNLVRSFMNQLAVEDRYLHRMAVKASKSIQSRVATEPEFAAASINGLMGSAGSVNFDQATKTKTVEKIVTEANLDALKQIVPLFEKLISQPGTTDAKAAAANRQSLAGLLLAIIRARASSQVSDDEMESVLEHILFIFVRFAYFMDNGDNQSQPAVTEQTQELFRSRINSCLNSLIANQKYAASLPYAVVCKIRDAVKSQEYGKFIINMGDPVHESVKTAFKSLKKLSSMEKKGEVAGAGAFKLLYSLTVLQVYNGDADAVSMLDELEFCYSKFAGGKESKKDEASDASDALVEILLSFASKQSQLFRRMSEQVFSAFADKVTEDGVDSLVSILEAKENLTGQQEMFEQDEDENEEDEHMMDVDEDDDDVEVVDASGGEDSQGEDDEADAAGDSDEDDDEAEVAAFESKLAAALGTHRGDQDQSHSDSSSDDDMDDDEMEQLDAKLINVFKARQQNLDKKKDKKDARDNMTNFKNRVLDLLDIFVKKCPSKLLTLDLLLPLLRLIRRSTVKQISTKAAAVLREYARLCKGSAVPALAPGSEAAGPVWELLRSVHKETGHSGPPAHAAACSQASLLLVKVLVAHDKAAIAGVVDVYGATRKETFLSRKCHVQPSFFTEWNNWCVSASRQMKN